MEGGQTPGRLYTLRDIPNKGCGLVAITKIAKGTRILAEPPLLKVPRNVRSRKRLRTLVGKQLSVLTDDQRQSFFSLYNAYGRGNSKVLGIARTNALPLGPDAATGGIFVEASRINHACNNNAQNTWNDSLQVLVIQATRDIEEGEEITISYLKKHANYAARQHALQTNFSFTCSCNLCSLPVDQRESSDRRLVEIRRLDALIGDRDKILSNPLQTLHDVHGLLELLHDEGITDASVPRACYGAFQVAILHGDLARAKVFAERVSSTRAVVEGHDSTDVQKLNSLAKDPSRHRTHGISQKWKTGLNDVSGDIGSDEFEDWLWRREKKETSQYANLRSKAAFPDFDALPIDYDLDLEYFDIGNWFLFHPRRHWCFLAEIVEIEYFIRLKLIVKDRAGHMVPVLFHTDSHGLEFVLFGIQKGFTIAILYAERHGFLDLSVGIRHQDPETLKIFPMAIEDLLMLSDRVQQYATGQDGIGVCHGCNRKKTSLKKCSRCKFFSYCDKSCQTVAWNEKDHKKDCKLLMDPDLQRLFLLKWDKFEKYHAFA